MNSDDIIKHRTLNFSGEQPLPTPSDDEDPGTCGTCGNPLELVRPGKSQCNHCPTLPRYGIQWNGPTQPIATPMPDGYWTPYHLAVERTSLDQAVQDAEDFTVFKDGPDAEPSEEQLTLARLTPYVRDLEAAVRTLGRCRSCHGTGIRHIPCENAHPLNEPCPDSSGHTCTECSGTGLSPIAQRALRLT